MGQLAVWVLDGSGYRFSSFFYSWQLKNEQNFTVGNIHFANGKNHYKKSYYSDDYGILPFNPFLSWDDNRDFYEVHLALLWRHWTSPARLASIAGITLIRCCWPGKTCNARNKGQRNSLLTLPALKDNHSPKGKFQNPERFIHGLKAIKRG
jgi:hypothetical protein